jgi:hypothetical protein
LGRAHKNCFGKQMQKKAFFQSIASFGIAFRVGREGIPFCPANLCPPFTRSRSRRGPAPPISVLEMGGCPQGRGVLVAQSQPRSLRMLKPWTRTTKSLTLWTVKRIIKIGGNAPE